MRLDAHPFLGSAPFFQGSSRVSTRPVVRARRFPAFRGSSPTGPGSVRNFTGRVGAGREVFKINGSSRVNL